MATDGSERLSLNDRHLRRIPAQRPTQVHTEEVTGSIPVSPTRFPRLEARSRFTARRALIICWRFVAGSAVTAANRNDRAWPRWGLRGGRRTQMAGVTVQDLQAEGSTDGADAQRARRRARLQVSSTDGGGPAGRPGDGGRVDGWCRVPDVAGEVPAGV
jgi:hypothetical protein